MNYIFVLTLSLKRQVQKINQQVSMRQSLATPGIGQKINLQVKITVKGLPKVYLYVCKNYHLLG